MRPTKFELLLIGAGGHCRSCIDVIEQDDRFRIAGIVDKDGEAESSKLKAQSEKRQEIGGKQKAESGKGEEGSGKPKRKVLGYQVIGTDDDLPELRKKYQYALITVGQIKSPDVRIRLFDRLQELRFELPIIVSPLAYVSPHARIGQGTIVMHHALVNAGARVGANCIINSKALIEHDAVVEDHCHIATGAVVNGGAVVGSGTFIGSNSVSLESVTIGKKCIIGGARVLTGLPDNTRHVR